MLGIPLALGSWWDLLTLVPVVAGVIGRLLDEERFLTYNLAGYADYTSKVHYRLVPFIW
jgi:protein-S-isoprenylcysteine O-methyltransferase Ste14